MSIKNKTVAGIKWSLIESIINQSFHFAVGVVLARLLSPSEFGIIGMITVFLAISQSLVDSGLTQSLIRKRDCTEEDYSTMFFANIMLGVTLYLVLFFSAGVIAKFYARPELFKLVRVMAINLVINSFGMIETARLIKRVDFKRQAKITTLSSVLSGFVGIGFALMGFSYWSLVIKTFTQNIVRVISLHYSSDWKPRLVFSLESLKEMWGFGIKLTLAGLITTIYRNVYKLIIGKAFSAADLGFYARAEQFKNLLSNNITSSIQKVTYPVMASISHNPVGMKAGYKRLMKTSFYVSNIFMLIMIVCAREIVLILIGPKWEPVIPMLKIICIAGMLYPLHAINLNMLKAMNRSDLFFRLEIIKKILVIPIIAIGIQYGMIALLWGMVFNSFLAYFINAFYSVRLLNYSTVEQLMDIAPTCVHTLAMAGLAFAIGTIAPSHLFISLFMKTGVALAYLVGAGYLFHISEFIEIKTIVIDQVKHHYMLLRNKRAASGIN